jgi:hypothetical protein
VAAPPVDEVSTLYAALARAQVLEVVKKDGRARAALAEIAKRCGSGEDVVLDLVVRFSITRDVLARRIGRRRDNEKKIAALDEIVRDAWKDQVDGLENRGAFGDAPELVLPLEMDAFAVLGRVKAYLQAQSNLAPKERAFFGLTRKATAESAAIGAFAARIEELAGAPLDDIVIELLGPFVAELLDREGLRRRRDAYKRRLSP